MKPSPQSVQVSWGSQWIHPIEWSQVDDVTINAKVVTRRNRPETVKFKNKRNHIAWRKTP